mmetsp:Transcript_40659/g.73315  ORF Transcript_40659/g.73315 Transcript_40659/m.73315 type:complete len:98 (+) Transcript_40659:332-625(+)
MVSKLQCQLTDIAQNRDSALLERDASAKKIKWYKKEVKTLSTEVKTLESEMEVSLKWCRRCRKFWRTRKRRRCSTKVVEGKGGCFWEITVGFGIEER